MREMVNSARRALGMPPAVFESFSPDDVGDGIIRTEADMRRAVAAARAELGLPPRDQVADDDAPGGIINSEASLEREVKRTRRALGLS
jgi:hypothetical protein